MPRKAAARPGDGSVYEDGPGRWKAQITIDGKIYRRRAKSKAEALAKLKELKEQQRQRLTIGSSQQTLAAWLESWLAARTGSKWKPSTAISYREVCDRYILPHLGKIRLERLSASHIEEWLTTLRKLGLSEGTIANAYRRLRTALAVAVTRKVLPDNPAAIDTRPSPKPGEINALDREQIDRLLSTLEAEQYRLYALFVLASTLGMRQSELIGLRWPQVQLDGAAPELRVTEQLQRLRDAATGRSGPVRIPSAKTDAGRRTIPLSPDLVAILKAHRKRQREERLFIGAQWRGDDLVFTSEAGGPINADNLVRGFKNGLKRAKLPVVTFHSLRHSAGSIMLAAGANLVDVSKILGHSSVAVTARVYAHSFQEGRRQAVELISAVLLRKGA